MEILASVITKKEKRNWLTSWMALDIARSGLERFVEIESQIIHKDIYQAAKSQANNHIEIEINKKHRYRKGSWNNSSDNLWSSNPWEVAKCYFPPKGYKEKHSVQETDFDGIINFMLNCLHFDSKFSFVISTGKTNSQTCLLFKARELRNEICHPASLEISDQKLHEYFIALIELLSDSKCLAQDEKAKTAVLKLKELQNDRTSLYDLAELLKKSHNTLKDKPGELIYKEMEETLAIALKELEARIQDLEERHKNTETRVQVLEERHVNTKTQIQDLEERHENTETEVKDLKERNENTETEVKDLKERNKNTETKVKDLKERHVNTETEVKDLKECTENTETEVKDLKERNKNTETLVQDLEERHENTKTRVQDLEQRNENTEIRVQDLKERHENTETRVQDLEGRHENTETRVQDLEERYENTETRVQDLEERHENIETEVKDLKEQNENIETQVQGLKERSKSNIQAVNQIGQEEYERGVAEMLNGLKTHYQKKLSHLTISPLNDSVAAPLDDFYVPLNVQLMKKDKGSFVKTGTQITEYKHVFSTDSKLNQHTFIQGEAGSGKSTFLAKLVMDWCSINTTQFVETLPMEETNNADYASPTHFFKDLTTLKCYKFVFRVTLRDSDQQFDICEIINKQIIDSIYGKFDRDNAYKLLNEIMKRERCLVLLDGLDEWIRPKHCHYNLPTLVANHSLCTLLITTRPWKLAEGKIKDSEIDILLQLEGINDPFELSRRILSRKYQDENDLEAKTSAFTEYIQEQELKELLHSPMMLSVIVCWHDEGGHELIGSKCEIYSLLLDSLLKKATIDEQRCHQHPPFNCFEKTQYIQPNIKHVEPIAEAAFCLLFSDTQAQVFSDKDLALKNVQMEFALKSGILKETKTSGLLKSSSKFSFFHKSIQEFLAAYYIARYENVIIEIIAGYLERYDKSYLAMTQLFIFLCGVSISAGNALSNLMNKSNVKYNSPRGDTLYQDCVFVGFREAVANRQSSINLRLTRFVINDISPDLQDLWNMNVSNVMSIIMMLPSVHRVYARFEIDLSLCHKLKSLKLSGEDIQFKGSASLATSEHQVCIVINNDDLSSVLGSIEDILFVPVICSSTWLRSLFSTLLTRDHEVKCQLESYIPSSSDDDELVKVATDAIITTGLNKTLNVEFQSDSPGLWQALHGLNIKSLCLSQGGRLRSNVKSMPQSDILDPLEALPLPTQLENPSPVVVDYSDHLWEALSSLTQLETLTLNIDIYLIDTIGLNKALSSLTQLQTLTLNIDISQRNKFWLYNVLYDLKIKNLGLSLGSQTQTPQSDNIDPLEALHVPLPTQLEEPSTVVVGYIADLWAVSSLRGLETLTLNMLRYINIQLPRLWSLKYLNIYCHGLHPLKLRELMEYLCASCSLGWGVELNLEFGCAECIGKDNVFKQIAVEDYNPILEELKNLKNLLVIQTRIFDRTSVTNFGDVDAASAWSVRGLAGVEDDNRDDDFLYDTFLKQMDNNIVIRIAFQVLIKTIRSIKMC